MAGSISQIQTNRQLVLCENLNPLHRHSANLLHCRSPLRLERVVHWEPIASRWRPAFSSHLVCAAKAGVANGVPIIGPYLVGMGSPASTAQDVARTAATHPYSTSKALNAIELPNIGE